MSTAKEQHPRLKSLKNTSCCDPFKCHSKRKTVGLREVSERFVVEHPSLNLSRAQTLCTGCRKKLSKLPPELTILTSGSSGETTDSEVPGPSRSPTHRDVFVSPNVDVDIVNQSLTIIGESPIKSKKKSTGSYIESKVKKIESTIKNRLETATGKQFQDDECEMISQLKEKFHSLTRTSEQVQVLTVLPTSWSIHKITEEFGASNYMARKAKKLVKEQGILAIPNPKSGKVLTKETEQKVRDFYLSEAISRQMPGMKDFVSVKVDGEKKHIQKHLILCNLKEAFEHFKKKYPDLRIGFSKFAELRPKQCV
ncbi:uncharacterized protein LOC119727987, partial [Patiria miniata]|uniref:Uncharacterized protein n=1 Tax=Patiria miniata TaxID=46514 RepID=A0A913ZY61_PATMI